MLQGPALMLFVPLLPHVLVVLVEVVLVAVVMLLPAAPAQIFQPGAFCTLASALHVCSPANTVSRSGELLPLYSIPFIVSLS